MSNSKSKKDKERMYVITRTGDEEPYVASRILQRLEKLISKQPVLYIDPLDLLYSFNDTLKSGIHTTEIDEQLARLSVSLSISKPHLLPLAGRILIDSHQKNTLNTFSSKVDLGFSLGKYKKEFHNFVSRFSKEIDDMIDYTRDFLLDYFGMQTFLKSYSNTYFDEKNKKIPFERPQDVHMRVAIYTTDYEFIQPELALSQIKESYDFLSKLEYTHGSPTIYNAGNQIEQGASCFLISSSDSLEGIQHTGTNASRISKFGGGIGVHLHSLRSFGSKIKGTAGCSNGIIPFLKTYESLMLAYNQGGRRKGSMVAVLEMHHPDLISFIELVLMSGDPKVRAPDLFTCLWVSDLFMERVAEGKTWSFFDPHETEDLSDYFGNEYKQKYLQLEKEKKFKKQLSARKIWECILTSQQERGIPYVCFKDSVNEFSNHKNIGIVKSTNLCSEIMLFSGTPDSIKKEFQKESIEPVILKEHKNQTFRKAKETPKEYPQEYAVCVLASISLPSCVYDSYNEKIHTNKDLDHVHPLNPIFDFAKLREITALVVRNLNTVVDKFECPGVTEAHRGNSRQRPIGIGVQGLADVFARFRFPFESKEATDLNKKIFETIYYAAITASAKLSRERYFYLKNICKQEGSVSVSSFSPLDYEQRVETFTNPDDIPFKIGAYPSMEWNGGSPIGNGIFHWEMMGLDKSALSMVYDWETTRELILKFGVRNSHVTAIMPTATTSQYLGNQECIEPFTYNIYSRETLAGQFPIINKYLMHDLLQLGVWNENLHNYLLMTGGSIEKIEGLPKDMYNLYKNAYEIDQNVLIKLNIDRQPFVDQAISMNLYRKSVSLKNMTNDLFTAWKGKLKSGKYYYHTKPGAMPEKFTIDPRKQKEMLNVISVKTNTTCVTVSKEEVCEGCSS